jgi:hypothetical protein
MIKLDLWKDVSNSTSTTEVKKTLQELGFLRV